jgi:hypothetical protein
LSGPPASASGPRPPMVLPWRDESSGSSSAPG